MFRQSKANYNFHQLAAEKDKAVSHDIVVGRYQRRIKDRSSNDQAGQLRVPRRRFLAKSLSRRCCNILGTVNFFV